jgi:hypothetical protein
MLWLRWIENDDSGTDHGLAIDDFSISATIAPSAASSVPDALPAGYVGAAFLGLLIASRARARTTALY